MFALAAGLALSLASACAAPTSYMGISLVPGGAPAGIQALAERARGGDKRAQLDLGIAFEQGRGVPLSPDLAARLFRMAGIVDGTIYAYQVPSLGRGRTVPIKAARLQPRDEIRAATPRRPADVGLGPFSIAGVVRDCPECPELVKVDGATPTGGVLLVGRYELKWQEYYRAVAATGCSPAQNPDGSELSATFDVADLYPITSIKPADIRCYLSWLSGRSGKKYRLPTDKEWVRIASLAGLGENETVQSYPRVKAYLRNEYASAGLVVNDPRVAVRQRLIQPVGSKIPDRIGLYDLVGNLPEMISDFPTGARHSAFDHPLVAVKGAGLATEGSFKLLSGYQLFLADHRTFGVGYRVVRED